MNPFNLFRELMRIPVMMAYGLWVLPRELWMISQGVDPNPPMRHKKGFDPEDTSKVWDSPENTGASEPFIPPLEELDHRG